MTDKIDMSLDAIIKMDGISGYKKGAGARRGGGNTGNAGSGSTARNNAASGNRNRGAMKNKMNRNNRSTPYSRASRIPDKWQHDMFDGPSRTPGSNHLLVSNLDYGVSDKDIQDLFAEFGLIKKAAVHYDRSGRSLGTADVIFEKRGDAAAAMKQYNGVLLDGRPMKITLVPSGDISQRSKPNVSSPGQGNFRSPKFGNASRGANSGTRSRGRGGGAGGLSNKGPRRNNQNRKSLTAEELDAELDAYVNK